MLFLKILSVRVTEPLKLLWDITALSKLGQLEDDSTLPITCGVGTLKICRGSTPPLFYVN
jgi:hypothetical protein